MGNRRIQHTLVQTALEVLCAEHGVPNRFTAEEVGGECGLTSDQVCRVARRVPWTYLATGARAYFARGHFEVRGPKTEAGPGATTPDPAHDIVQRLRQVADADEAKTGFFHPILTEAACEILALRAQIEQLAAELDGAREGFDALKEMHTAEKAVVAAMRAEAEVLSQRPSLPRPTTRLEESYYAVRMGQVSAARRILKAAKETDT